MQHAIARPVIRALLAAVCAATVLGIGAGAAAAQAPSGTSVIPPGSGYLALGDSVSFGFQESSVIPAPDYTHAKNFKGFPEILAKIMHLKVANLACSGETSASLIDKHAQSNGCENRANPGGGPPLPGGYRTQFPLHVAYTGSQLQYAVRYLEHHPDTQLVTLMIGANDAFVCQVVTADHCTAPAELGAVLAQIQTNITTILHAIRGQANYQNQIAVVNYYSLDYSSALDTLQAQLLNQAMDSAAKPFGAVVADGFGEFQAQAAMFGGSTCNAGLLTVLGGQLGTCGIHPSYAGQSLLADAVAKVVRH